MDKETKNTNNNFKLIPSFSSDNLKKLYDSDDIVFEVDENYKVVSLNKTALRLFKKTEKEIVGQKIKDLFPPDLAALYSESLERVFSSEIPYSKISNLKTENNSILINTSLTPILDKNGKLKSVIGISRDITKDYLNEIALDNSEIAKLKAGVEKSPVSIIITDTDANIEYANPVFYDITGYTVNEAIGSNPKILNSGHHSKEFYKNLWEIIKKGDTWIGEFLNKKKNGDLYWESAKISSIRNKEGLITNYIAIKEDITSRKKTEEDLKQSKKKYKDLTNQLPVIVFELDSQANLVYLNKAGKNLAGINELGKTSLLDFFIDEDKSKIAESLKSNFSGKHVTGNVYKAIDSKGSTRSLQIFNNPVYSGKK
ncbi:PAS domain S-box protein [Bacteroidota bacterium]